MVVLKNLSRNNRKFLFGILLVLIPVMVLIVLVLGCKSPDTTMGPQQIRRPNILWITCEDMSPRLGAYGDSIAFTPNIDRLAEESVLFTNAFSVSGVCAPSRAALIMGLYPTSFGALHMRTIKRTAAIAKITDPDLLAIPVYEAVPPPEAKCFSEILRLNGYYCTNNSKNDYQFHAPVTAWDQNRDQMPLMQELLRLDEEGLLEGIPALWFANERPKLEFYDTWEDPHEVNNLADAPEHTERIGIMLNALTTWGQKTGDMGGIPEPELVKQLWPPDGIQPVTQSCTMNITEKDKIELESTTKGASLAYQFIHQGDTSKWMIYKEPIKIRDGQLRAFAHRIGFKPSEETLYEGQGMKD